MKRPLVRTRMVAWALAIASVAAVVAAWAGKYAIATPLWYRTVWSSSPFFLVWGPIGSRHAQGVDIRSGIAIALTTGAVGAAAVLAFANSVRGDRVNWRRLVASVLVAFLANATGLLCGRFLSLEEGFRAWLIIGLGAILMPGVWAITALSRRFDAVQYLAGLALNMVVWSGAAFALLRRRFVRA